MSFATCCPSCRTTFRVVRDQLKVSEGWVRCGRCGEVFCALDTLFELDRVEAQSAVVEPRSDGRAAPPAVQTAATPAAPAASLGWPDLSSPSEEVPNRTGSSTDPLAALQRTEAAAPPEADERSAPRPVENEVVDTEPVPLQEPARHEPAHTRTRVPEEGVGTFAAQETGLPDAALPRPQVPASPDSAEDPPGFAALAAAPERRPRPVLRAAVGVLAGLLLLLLALQIVLHQRDRLAADVPALRPWLVRGCAWIGCEIGPLRRIDDLVLDHSALSEAAPGQGYRLSLMLRNRGRATVALPAFELTLTDTRGQLMARRVLLPSDFGSSTAGLGPRAQLALDLALDVPGGRAVGYTVEIFYP